MIACTLITTCLVTSAYFYAKSYEKANKRK
ncbi:hypothetical protein SAMN05880574_10125 [Chryseobacterium sp. RU37D]|nr:hypothetical protein SAMN05880574_10125 [Chryseobacterium sp. RU37D]